MNARSSWLLLLSALLACAPVPSRIATLPSPLLIAAGDDPGMYLSSEPDAPKIAFLSSEVQLYLLGPDRDGRVPVRVEGPLRVEGYVATERLVLRVQRRGRLRGAPVYLGPGDLVRVLGREQSQKRLEVQATVRVGALTLGPFTGSYPVQGLAPKVAPSDAAPPDIGSSVHVPPDVTINLFDTPDGTFALQLPPQAEPYEVRVLAQHGDWLAVRAGAGPYVIGWTLALDADDAVEPELKTAPRSGLKRLPTRLAEHDGELKRVARGTKIRFGDRIIGVFAQRGWARVLHRYENGTSDVFAAVDDDVAIRGLVPSAALSDEAIAESVSETATEAAAR